MFKTFETEFAGRKLSVEIGKYAEQANGDRKSTRLNSSHYQQSRMPSSA